MHTLNVSQKEDLSGWRLEFAGDWLLHRNDNSVRELLTELREKLKPGDHLDFIDTGIGKWNSALVVLVERIRYYADEHGAKVDISALPVGVQKLCELANSQGAKKASTPPIPRRQSLVEIIGESVINYWHSSMRSFAFIGDLIFAIIKLFTGKACLRGKDVISYIADAGPGAFGIVALISVLIGMILAFVGAVQLQQFGASIYVASLVALGMAREMAAMMTAIIMAGRTGASYAAQLGSMQVNEEVDALQTMGLKPMEFLVLPRFIALLVMLPLLTIFSMALGILGGGIVSLLMLDISFSQYFEQMTTTVPLRNFAIGLIKSALFAVVIAVAGCYNGINCGRSATAVGQATTRAVVMAIVYIIVVDAIVTIITTVMGV